MVHTFLVSKMHAAGGQQTHAAGGLVARRCMLLAAGGCLPLMATRATTAGRHMLIGRNMPLMASRRMLLGQMVMGDGLDEFDWLAARDTRC